MFLESRKGIKRLKEYYLVVGQSYAYVATYWFKDEKLARCKAKEVAGKEDYVETILADNLNVTFSDEELAQELAQEALDEVILAAVRALPEYNAAWDSFLVMYVQYDGAIIYTVTDREGWDDTLLNSTDQAKAFKFCENYYAG